MISALRQTLTECAALLPDSDRAWAAVLLRPDLAERLAAQLTEFHQRGGPIDRPEPNFAEEVTPPLGPVFEPFRPLLAEGSCEVQRWAEALAAVGVGGALLLLGQRRTPASLTDVNAIPPPRETLIGAASAPCNPGVPLSVAGRAWAKHAPRSGEQFWGTVSGGNADKNTAALRLVETILGGATWWNVFGHFVHDTVFEARVPSGHGARWGNRGTVFIGFLEPFINEEKR
jgi:hypothetical protein